MHTGELIRELRKAKGWSQVRLARELTKASGTPIGRDYISRRWESGRVIPSARWTPHLARVLGVPRDLLEDDPMKRREFLGVAAGVALSFARPELAGRRLGATDVDRLARRTARLRRLDDIMGGAETYPLFAAELDATNQLVKSASCTPAIADRLRALIAEQAQLAGWAAFDGGRHATATRHYMASHVAAKEASEPVLAGNALAFLAYQNTWRQQSGVDTAEASYATAHEAATPKVRALLLERLAWSHAVAGEPDDAAAALDRSRAALDEPSRDPEPDWVFWIDTTEIDIMTGRC